MIMTYRQSLWVNATLDHRDTDRQRTTVEMAVLYVYTGSFSKGNFHLKCLVSNELTVLPGWLISRGGYQLLVVQPVASHFHPAVLLLAAS